ncbi:Uncharacterised protein [uncultured archaeon]|nr:Uncharacterised protein [uncultured archaeon]
MSIISLLILIALIILAVIAFKFLVGALKKIIPLAIVLIAIAYLIYVLTGHDPFAVQEAVGKAISFFK